MPRIFVFPAGNADAQRNLEISIRSPVPAHTVLGAVEGIGDRELEQLERIRQEGPGFYAWGAQPSIDLGNEHTWQAMERGDYVLAYYGRAYHYVAQVLGKSTSPDLRGLFGRKTQTEEPGSICTSSPSPRRSTRPLPV
jgi:hypothetical protein